MARPLLRSLGVLRDARAASTALVCATPRVYARYLDDGPHPWLGSASPRPDRPTCRSGEVVEDALDVLVLLHLIDELEERRGERVRQDLPLADEADHSRVHRVEAALELHREALAEWNPEVCAEGAEIRDVMTRYAARPIDPDEWKEINKRIEAAGNKKRGGGTVNAVAELVASI